MKVTIVIAMILAILVIVSASEFEQVLDDVFEEVMAESLAESMGSSCTVTASSLSLRSSPSTYGSRVAYMSRGSRVSLESSQTYSGSGYQWKKVRYGSKVGYAAANYLSCSSGGSTGGSSGGCQLMRYRNSVFQGKEIVADKDWRSSLDRIASYARSCGVKIHVTSSYRSNANVNGAIVTPASRSNHMAGQAIDMNVVAREGWCNSSCLRNPRGSTKCFIDKIKNDSSMRWGGAFNDPVHIDSGLNVRSRSQWDAKYQATQRAYQSRCY